MIDLRSDTVTKPTPRMRDAMRDAVVGDDFYRDDPTVIELEQTVAGLLGKDAGLFVPSGTMANLLATMTHCPAGGELVGPDQAHVFCSEGAGSARLARVAFRPIPQVRGEVDVAAIAAATTPRTLLDAGTSLLWMEQPTRGYIVEARLMDALREVADRTGVPIHVDGARLFHVAAALDVSAASLVAGADSVMCCMSKGLGAPVGSVLTGSEEFVRTARLNRQMLGGGMRQGGVLAAAALYAINHHRGQLKADNDVALALSMELRQIAGLEIDRDVVETNIFYVKLPDGTPTNEFVARLKLYGVLASEPRVGTTNIRLVTHLEIRPSDVQVVGKAFRQALSDAQLRSDKKSEQNRPGNLRAQD